MKHIYVIPGTGVPKDMAVDFNHQLFIRAAFNRIIDECVQNKIKRPVIILSGGPTDCWPPFKRTEAAELAKTFKDLMTRPAVKPYTRDWQVRLETRSISGLEHYLFLKPFFKPGILITWFSEWTRAKKYGWLGRRLYGRNIRIVPIDYDVSANRYRYNIITNQEKLSYAFDLWALKSPANLRAHHRYHATRLTWLRKFPPTKHVIAVKQWNDLASKKLPADFQRQAKRRGLI